MNNDTNLPSLSDETIDLVRAVLETLAGPGWIVDGRGKVLIVNTAGAMIFPPTKKVGVLEGANVPIDLGELIVSVCRERRTVEIPAMAIDGIWPENGSLTQIRVVPLDLPPDEPMLLFISLMQCSLSGELTIQNIENEKFKSMTGLAAKLAHELNNPLDGSLRYIKLAMRRLQQPETPSNSPDKVTEYLSSAQEALGKINEILSDLSQFARHGQATIETFSINKLIEQAVRTLSARASLAGVSIECQLDENLPRAGGPNLYQVFCNLLKNAIDAVVEKKRQFPQGKGVVTIYSKRTATTVQIIFEDTGTGLPSERQYLFDPFFTTKPPGEGTGLGLAICKEIVGQYCGKISAENRPEGGAKFIVEIPSAEESSISNSVQYGDTVR
jgi:signal transduction histidine kinase